MWKEDSGRPNAKQHHAEPVMPGIEPAPDPVPAPVPPAPPAARRAILILAGFFLLQVVLGLVFGIVLGVLFVVGGGDPAATETLTANMEGYTMQINLLASCLASIALVLWIWQQAKNPLDGISFQFLGLHRDSLRSLGRPAAVGAGLGFAYLVTGGLFIAAPEGTEFGPMTTLSMASGWGLLMWAVLALLFAPFVEELLFRSILLKGFLQSWPAPPASTIAIAVTVVGFTAFHYQEFVYYPFAALAILSMAIAATYFRLQTDNLLAAVAVHFSYNLALVFALLLARLAV